MKRISFFSVIKSIVISSSLLIVMVITSFVLVSMTQFNHVDEKITYQEIEIYKKNDIDKFDGYIKDNNLFLIIKMKKAQSQEYLIDYAYHYYFIFQTLIYLEVNNINEIRYININKEGISTYI